jgi:predicted permease
MSRRPPLLQLARRVHRALLILAPRHVRRAYRAQMIDTFEAASEAAGSRGAGAVCRLLLHELQDLLMARRVARSSAGSALAMSPDDHRGPGRKRSWMDGTAWRQTMRSLFRRPAYSAAAIATLGFGSGVLTAVFSLVDTVLIKPLPYPDADQLVTVYESSPVARERTSLVAPVRLEDWQRLNRTFVALSASYGESMTDTSGADPERLDGRRVLPRFFAVFGAPPIAGRTFTDLEEAANGPSAAVISQRFWARRFNRDPAAVGRALTIGGRRYPIVGVMAEPFAGGGTDVWLPAQLSPVMLELRDARFVNGIGRMKPGVTVEAAAQDLLAVQQGLARQFPKTDSGWSAELRPLKEMRIGNAHSGLTLVFAAVASLWLMAVANIAGLMLAQVHRRSGELALRVALGASRLRVIGTVIREGLVLAALGGLLGTTIALWLTSIMTSVLTTTPRIGELAMDWRALGFALATNVAAAGTFSLVPALAATRRGLTQAVGHARTVAGGRHRLQKMLVVAQVAVGVLLVGCATLLGRSYVNLTRVATGFDSTDVITFRVGARWDEDRGRVGQLQTQLLANLEELPHVAAAGMTNFLPASGASLRYQVRVDGLAGANADGTISVGTRMISAGYLRAIRAPLLAGAWCAMAPGNSKSPLPAMVNRRFVDRHAVGQNLVGRPVKFASMDSTFAITGVVGDLSEDNHATSPVPYLYTCPAAGSWPDPEYVVRTSDARALAADLRRIVREIDPSRAIFDVRPLQEVMDARLDQPRLDAAVLGLFAGAALLLAAIGLYSLFMLVVSERVREIAVRLAIGAAPGQVMRLVFSGAGRLLAAGVVIGVALAAGADRLLRGLLFGVGGFDLPAMTAALLTMTIVSVVAVAGPALRAARVQPILVLRESSGK